MGTNGNLLINFIKNIRFKIYESKFSINKNRHREPTEALSLVFTVKTVSSGTPKKMDKSYKNQNHLLLTMHNTNNITNAIEK